MRSHMIAALVENSGSLTWEGDLEEGPPAPEALPGPALPCGLTSLRHLHQLQPLLSALPQLCSSK